MGFIFEDICIQYLKLQNKNKALPFVFDKIGRWWGNNPLEKKQEKIDIIALNGNEAIFGECKWKDIVNTDVLNNLKRKAAMLRQFDRKYFWLFSKGSFSGELCTEAAKDSNVRLITLDDIYKLSKKTIPGNEN